MHIQWKAGDTLMLSGIKGDERVSFMATALEDGDNASLKEVSLELPTGQFTQGSCRFVWMVRHPVDERGRRPV